MAFLFMAKCNVCATIALFLNSLAVKLTLYNMMKKCYIKSLAIDCIFETSIKLTNLLYYFKMNKHSILFSLAILLGGFGVADAQYPRVPPPMQKSADSTYDVIRQQSDAAFKKAQVIMDKEA